MKEGKKEMSLDSRSENILEDKFFEIVDELMGEGMCKDEAIVRAEIDARKWWEELG